MGRRPRDAQQIPKTSQFISDRLPISSEILKYITDNFLSGQLDPGAKLPSERQFSESLSVPRSAVRDAIQSLGILGVVEIRQGDGTYLCEDTKAIFPATIEWGLFLGQRRVMDLVEAREQIEIALSGFAARRRTEEQLATIAAIVKVMQSKKIESSEFVSADIAFHLAIAEASGNSALADMLSNITSLLRVWMARSIRAAGETHSTLQEHVAVYEAIKKSDSRSAQAAMRRHMCNAEKRLRMTLAIPPEAIVKMFPHDLSQDEESNNGPKNRKK